MKGMGTCIRSYRAVRQQGGLALLLQAAPRQHGSPWKNGAVFSHCRNDLWLKLNLV